MQAKSDAQLLRDYATGKSEPAFSEIVQRYTDLVYSAAMRQAGSQDLASEIAQRVFIDLARKARPLARNLRDDGSLAGWLYRATRYAALNVLRDERRRHARQIQIMHELYSSAETPPDWELVSPLLDEAISALDEQEREALLLRFFKNQNFRDVGAALGVSDDTAQKRVARSLEKLRAALLRRGVTTTTSALAAALGSQAVQAAPLGLATALASISLSSATAQGGAFLTLIKLMSMTKLQLGLCAIVIGGLVVTVTIQNQAGAKLRGENQGLREQLTGLASDAESLSNRLARIQPASTINEAQLRELARLRSEVGRLRQQTNLLATLEAEKRASKARLEATPDDAERIKFLETKTIQAAKQIGVAFRIWANDNDHQYYPSNFAEIHNELANVTNFEGNIPLDNFELVNVGKVNETYPQAAMVRERVPRATTDGAWMRVYLLADGSVQEARSTDGNFEAWEQSNLVNAFPSQ